MSLKARLGDDMKQALRAGDKHRLSTLRMTLAAIQQREVDERIELDDAQVLSVVEKMIKQRRESALQFRAGDREELAQREEAEIGFLDGYLPEPMSEARTGRDDRPGHRRHRGRVHARHGQGHEPDKAVGRGPCRHGRGQREGQGAARRRLRPPPAGSRLSLGGLPSP